MTNFNTRTKINNNIGKSKFFLIYSELPNSDAFLLRPLLLHGSACVAPGIDGVLDKVSDGNSDFRPRSRDQGLRRSKKVNVISYDFFGEFWTALAMKI